MKKLVSFFKYLGLAVGVIFLEQLPVAFLRKNQPFWQILMLILAFLVVTLVTVLIAKRLGFLNHASQLLTRDAWKSIFMGFLVMIPVRMLGGITLVLEHGTKANTLNQSVIENLGMSPALLFVMTVVAAPIVEEFVFRGLIVGALHMPTDLGSWILYGGMGLVLAMIYRKTQKLEFSIAVHALNNFLGVLSMIL